MIYRKKIQPLLAVTFLSLLTLLIAACGNGIQASNASNSLNSAFNAAHKSTSGQQPTITSTAVLIWDAHSKQLLVTLTVSGLKPNSTHPDHIHAGNCSMMGNVVYPLNNVVADKNGRYTGSTLINNIPNGIPASGWYINIHEGPTLNGAGMNPIACGNIVNPNTHAKHQIIKVTLSGIFIGQFSTISKVASTVPDNGDVNPYGTAVIEQNSGRLVKGNVLVSNFNNSANDQGTGTTIVEIDAKGEQVTFAQLTQQTCPGGIGLTTALVVLKRGWVIVGSLPTGDGAFAHAHAGCLIVLNSNGQVVATWHNNQINGPWDAVAQEDNSGDDVSLFVSNTLNGNVAGQPNKTINQGNVVRFELRVPQQGHGTPNIVNSHVIANGIGELTDGKAALQGPTGLGLASNGTLYIADTVNSRILTVQNALNRNNAANANQHILSSGGKLNGELGLTIAPNGDILTVNGNDGNLVEITPGGVQIATQLIDNTPVQGAANGAGCLFNLAVVPNAKGLYFVDDCTNQLNLLS